jgi:hypothetical protein
MRLSWSPGSRAYPFLLGCAATVFGCGPTVTIKEQTPEASVPDADSTPSCVAFSGKSVACPVKVSKLACASGDADSCEVPTLVQVTVGGNTSPCLHLVFTSGCSEEAYATTCIQFTLGGGTQWQCWTSSTLPGSTVDVSQCDATGKYFHFASTSSGELTVLNSSCPSPG